MQNEISQQQKNSSRVILTQIGHMSPVGWKPRARQQFSASKTRICSSRTVAGQFQHKSGMPPFGWKPRAKKQQFQRRQSDSSQQQNSSRAVSNQIGHAPVRLEAATIESRSSSSVQKKRDIAAVERWRGSFNPNRPYTRSVGSAGPDSSSVQANRDFAAAGSYLNVLTFFPP